MHTLRLLGPVALAETDGASLLDALAQPKRIALLCYLAVTRPPGLRTRDHLLALFWPDADGAHARNSLSQALHGLRRSLGAATIVVRGDQVGVDPTRVECDVMRFRALLREGRALEAVELYGGPFLDGFYADASPEFESWVEEERAALRAEAFAAATALAERAEQVGDLHQAIRWTRRALEIVPLDEAAVRKLIGLQAGAGDRSGALATYGRFVERLRRDLELEPSPATAALAAAVPTTTCTVLAPPVRAPEPAVPVRIERGAVDAEIEALAASLPAARRPRATVRWVSAVVLSVLVPFVALTAWRTRRAAPPARTLAVFPFCVVDDVEGRRGADVATLVAVALDGTAGWRAVDENALLTAASRRRIGCRDVERARGLAADLQSGGYLLGSLARTASGVRADAWLYDARGQLQTTGSYSAPSSADLLVLADGLARELAPTMSGAAGEPTRVAARTTTSLVALKAYLEGEERFRGGDWRAAIDAFERAVAADSMFALAWLRLSVAYEARGEQSDPVRRAAARAERLAAMLPARERLLLRAWTARANGRAAEAMERFRAYLGEYPGDPFALSNLADLEFHYGPLFGRPSTQARDAFERVLALDPENDEALNHLGAIARLEGRHAEADSLRERWMASSPSAELALTTQVERAFLHGDARARDEALRAVRSSTDLVVLFAPAWALWAGSIEGAEALHRLGTDASRAAPVRVRSHVRLAFLALRRGRPSESRAELARAAKLDPHVELMYSSWIAALPVVETRPEEIEALRARLARDTVAAPWEGGLWTRPEAEMDEHVRLYLLGLFAARQSQRAAARAYADTLARMRGPAQAPLIGPNLAHGVRAALAWYRGDAAATLRETEAIEPVLSFALAQSSPFASGALERFLRAEALRALGRGEDALGWYESLGNATLSGMAHLRAGEIHERAGRWRAAAAHYRLITTDLATCDPGACALREQAGERLARVERR